MPRPRGCVFLRPESRPPTQLVPFLWSRVRGSNLIWNLPVSIRERIFRLSIQSTPPQYLAFPEHGRRYIDGVARPPPRDITAKWAPLDFPFDVDALPPLPMIKSKKRLRRLFRCPELAEALSVRDREGRMRTSWKAYDGIGDKLVNRAASLAVYRGLLKGVPSPSPSLLSCNNTLAYMSVAYRLHYGLRYYKELGDLPIKIAADIFEAYIGALHKELHREHQSHILVEWFKKLHDPAVWPEWSTHQTAHKWRKPAARAKQATKSIERMRYLAQRSPPSSARSSSSSQLAALGPLAGAHIDASSLHSDSGPIAPPATRVARIKAAMNEYPEVEAWRRVRYELSGSEQEVDAFFAGYCREDEEACLSGWEDRPSKALLPVLSVQMAVRDSTAILRLDAETLRTLQVQRQIQRMARLLKKIRHLARLGASKPKIVA